MVQPVDANVLQKILSDYHSQMSKPRLVKDPIPFSISDDDGNVEEYALDVNNPHFQMTNSVVKYIDQESDDKFMTSAAYICRANAYFEIIVNHQSDLIRLGHIIKNDKETLISTEIIRVAAEAKMDRKGKIQFKEISKMIKKIS